MAVNQLDISAKSLLNMAILRLSDVFPGQIFFVKDLFPGIYWNRIPSANRVELCESFLQYVEEECAENIEKLGEALPDEHAYCKR